MAHRFVSGCVMTSLLAWGAIGCGTSAHPVGPASPVSVEIERAPAKKTASVTQAPELAVHGTPDERDRAIAVLRGEGPDGLSRFMSAHQEPLERLRRGERTAELSSVRHAVEQIAQQRDAFASGLYWHTDLGTAQQRARAENKPILSLRMLGALDEEMSCANSRFFRVVLYADPSVSALLREHFVLHWSSERPVPTVTIDMGDGRTIERTITGNSIHYVLDAAGQPLDALPGLYAPNAFVQGLERADALHNKLDRLDADARDLELAQYHAEHRDRLAQHWQLERIKAGASEELEVIDAPVVAPAAATAVPIAVAKSRVEAPILRQIQLADIVPLPKPDDGEAYDAFVASIAESIELSEATMTLVQAKLSEDNAAAYEAMMDNFVLRLAEDTVHNEYALHRTLHGWLALSPPVRELSELNQRVYADLFLTPRSDPWLGLVPAGEFAAIEGAP